MNDPWDAGERFDPKKLLKPESFGSDAQQSWRKWRTSFEYYMGGLDPIYAELLDKSAKASGPITMRADMAEIDTRQKMNTRIYAELAELPSGKPGQIAKNLYEK
eukprot:10911997-Alexandrium_andersonii.AAC.1